MLEETWQAIRARHPEIPLVVVVIIASGTTGRDARWGRFDPSGGPSTPPAPQTRSFSFRPPQSHIFEGGTANVDLTQGRRRSVASPVTIPCVRRSGGSPRSGDDQSPAWWQT
jgi:hypothetical protein